MTADCFDALIFDNDGVLVNSEIIHVSVEMERLAELGLRYERADYIARFCGMGQAEFRAALAEDYGRLGLGDFPADFGEQVYALAWPRIEAELEALPGAEGLIARFEGPAAVASSAPTARLRRKLELVGLLNVFHPHIYSGEQVPRGKPAPDLFLHAAMALQIQPGQCLVIEDSVHGVRAAQAAGMTVFGFTGGGHADGNLARRLAEAGAHAVFESHERIGFELFGT